MTACWCNSHKELLAIQNWKVDKQREGGMPRIFHPGFILLVNSKHKKENRCVGKGKQDVRQGAAHKEGGNKLMQRLARFVHSIELSH